MAEQYQRTPLVYRWEPLDDSDETSYFRFLDLPPELREQIYIYVFVDEAPYQLPLLDWKYHLPNPSVTAVSSAIRLETLDLFQKAWADVWNSHEWVIRLESDIKKECCLERLLARCRNLPLNMNIDELTFSFALARPRKEENPTEVQAEVSRTGLIWYSVEQFGSADPDLSGESSAMCKFVRAMKAEERHTRFFLEQAMVFQDVEQCVKTFCSKVRRHL